MIVPLEVEVEVEWGRNLHLLWSLPFSKMNSMTMKQIMSLIKRQAKSLP